jgi:hypothetical protein
MFGSGNLGSSDRKSPPLDDGWELGSVPKGGGGRTELDHSDDEDRPHKQEKLDVEDELKSGPA